jgi:cyanoexosortase A
LLGNLDPSPLTAKLAGYLLWYSGFETIREGVNLYFAGSSNGVEVYPGCSGLASIIDLLSLTLLFFLMFPSNWKTKFILPIAAILIGFVLNGIRVALLAVIVIYHNRVGFDYWHSGEGSLLFSMLSMSLLCAVIYSLIQSPSPLAPEQEETE